MIFANLFYWCSNQYVISVRSPRVAFGGSKRRLAVRLFQGAGSVFHDDPGVIAYHLYGPGLGSIDLAYPQLVKDTLPVWALGFFLAVLLGAVFSSFNSLINSAATMLTLDVIQPLSKKPLADTTLVRIAKVASVVSPSFR